MQLQSLDSAVPPLVNESGGTGFSSPGAGSAQRNAGNAADIVQQVPSTLPVVAATAQQLKEAVGQANASLQKVASSLQFEIDPDTKETVIRLVDTSDNKVLRQVPSPEVLAIAKAIDKMQGLLIKQVA